MTKLTLSRLARHRFAAAGILRGRAEYVVAHEPVFLREPAHGGTFWSRLERTMPDFAACEQGFAERSALYVPQGGPDREGD